MRAFIATALGGTHHLPKPPATWRPAHAGLGITDARRSTVSRSHLAGALGTLGVPSEQVKAILARVAPLRDEIVGGEPARVG